MSANRTHTWPPSTPRLHPSSRPPAPRVATVWANLYFHHNFSPWVVLLSCVPSGQHFKLFLDIKWCHSRRFFDNLPFYSTFETRPLACVAVSFTQTHRHTSTSFLTLQVTPFSSGLSGSSRPTARRKARGCLRRAATASAAKALGDRGCVSRAFVMDGCSFLS